MAGALAPSLAAELLDRGPAGVALADARASHLGELAGALARGGRGVRVETLPVPGVWIYGISASRLPSGSPDPGAPPPSPSPRRSPR